MHLQAALSKESTSHPTLGILPRGSTFSKFRFLDALRSLRGFRNVEFESATSKASCTMTPHRNSERVVQFSISVIFVIFVLHGFGNVHLSFFRFIGRIVFRVVFVITA